ncbi:N-acetyltransferase [Aspergillus sclerotiicarbonarius CBS 121057]|uniref:N-acetyltransferase n=1 Tax=Aspergillus sclerotiicarbonarius (strain CBS 121057 / IBT 28362) TaxID=1448318 RepID=A0A319EAW9_ASPSB|nr:N-acetyltransferase [Aspergillus sclerotiicarbonarius CBS 121057]
MLLNAKTAISTSMVLLVPYSKWHVPRYHEWMQDEEIQEATASEPLSIGEEYAMQQSWRQDPDKLTFIVCLPAPGPQSALQDTDDTTDRMVGDINLFLRVDDGEEGDAEPQIIGEIELMIAEKGNQRKGFGKAALNTFLRYIVEHEGEILEEFVGRDEGAKKALKGKGEGKGLRLECLSVKIGKANERSLALFEGASFRKVAEEPNYFGEFELRRGRGDLGREAVDGGLERAGVRGYDEMVYDRLE